MHTEQHVQPYIQTPCDVRMHVESTHVGKHNHMRQGVRARDPIGFRPENNAHTIVYCMPTIHTETEIIHHGYAGRSIFRLMNRERELNVCADSPFSCGMVSFLISIYHTHMCIYGT